MGSLDTIQADTCARKGKREVILLIGAPAIALIVHCGSRVATLHAMPPQADVVELVLAGALDAIVDAGNLMLRLSIKQAVDVEARLCAHENAAVRDRRHAEFDVAIDAIAGGIQFAVVEFVSEIGCVIGVQ